MRFCSLLPVVLSGILLRFGDLFELADKTSLEDDLQNFVLRRDKNELDLLDGLRI